MPKTKPLLCPFCGGEPYIQVRPTGQRKNIYSVKCHCGVLTHFMDRRYKAVAIWNKRANNGTAEARIRVPIHIAKDGRLVPAGYAEVETFDAEELWHLCNWSCYQEEKPDNLFSEIDYCGHGICFTNPKTNQKWLALSVGWYITDDMQEIGKYVCRNADRLVWRKENDEKCLKS